MKNKPQVIAHQIAMNKVARYHESDRQRVARLLYFLSRPNPLYNRDGSIKDVTTIRAYLLKYDRKEYRHILSGIRRNMTRGFSNINGLGMRYLDEFKPDQYSTMQLTKNLLWSIQNQNNEN